ncbi:unnamed protein product [Penicillium egyptiacum]|uniref:Nucleoside phosphorylase domain-containing protein n=1 Tax=Penicillium egyptiacum TaxID=1303716 RepID=A0A9W4KFF1_9EURO|nr:unnamed protein product [Penicillium egyptiacum]
MENPGELPRREDFRVGWITALYNEYLAARQVLDVQYEDFELSQHANDSNHYTFGRIGKLHVVIASLPASLIGTHSASVVANGLRNTFPLVRFALMVGIAGGAPTEKNDVRLGDVIIGTTTIPYSFIKQHPDRREAIGHNVISARDLLSTINSVRAKMAEGSMKLDDIVSSRFNRNEEIIDIFQRPHSGSDRLYRSDYTHCSSCDCLGAHSDNSDKLVQREARKAYAKVKVHCGRIGSADILLRDAIERDRLTEEFNLLGFEMESAGICLPDLPILPIRGVCDYADSHKNKQWQGYAAAVAAVYARCLLQTVSSGDLFTPNKPIEGEKLRRDIEQLMKTVTDVTSGHQTHLKAHDKKFSEADEKFNHANCAIQDISMMVAMLERISKQTTEANTKAFDDVNRKTSDNTEAIALVKREIEDGRTKLEDMLEKMKLHIQQQQELSPPEQKPKWENLQVQAQKESLSLGKMTEDVLDTAGNMVIEYGDVLGNANVEKAGRIIKIQTQLLSMGRKWSSSTKKAPADEVLVAGHVQHSSEIPTANTSRPIHPRNSQPRLLDIQGSNVQSQEKKPGAQPSTGRAWPFPFPLRKRNEPESEKTTCRQPVNKPPGPPLPPRNTAVVMPGPFRDLSQKDSYGPPRISIGSASETPQTEVKFRRELDDVISKLNRPSCPPRPESAKRQLSCSICLKCSHDG